MIDLAILRESPDDLREALARRQADIDVDELVDLDARRRAIRSEAEQVRAEQRLAGKEISRLEGETKQKAIAEAGQLAESYERLLAEADELDGRFQDLWINVPNMAHPSAPDGTTEDDAVEVSRWGTPPQLDFPVRDHQELGESLESST